MPACLYQVLYKDVEDNHKEAWNRIPISLLRAYSHTALIQHNFNEGQDACLTFVKGAQCQIIIFSFPVSLEFFYERMESAIVSLFMPL